VGISVKNYYPATVKLDDDQGDQSDVTIHIKRLTIPEYAVFKTQFARVGEPPSNKMLARQPEGAEQARDDHGLYKISESRVRESRLAEMDAATRATYDRLDAEDEAFARQFLLDTVRAYISVPDGEITWEGRAIRTGEDLIELYHAQLEVIQLLVRTVLTENTLNNAQKKALRSLSDFQRSLNARVLGRAGRTPDGTAASVDAPATAPVAAATASIEDPSGSEALH
jgi:hypothetical protein